MTINWGAVTISIGLILLAGSTSMGKVDYVGRHCNEKDKDSCDWYWELCKFLNTGNLLLQG